MSNNYWGAKIVSKREYDCIIENGVITKYFGNLTSVIIPSSVTSIASDVFSSQPTKVIWLTNTPPSGYANAAGKVNYVANNNYTNLNYKTVYPFLSSMFEVDGIKYVPVSPSERTCDVIDCIYDEYSTEININSTVTYKGVNLKVRNVKSYSFYENNNLQKINLGISGSIGKYVCSGCNNLQTAVFGQEVTEIEDCAFQGCSKLDKIVIPDAVNTIGQYAFSGCSSLNDVQIGQNVISIGGYAFSGCSTLPKIQIPQSVTSIANNAFQGCSGLKTMIMDNGDSDLSLSSNGSYPMFTDCPLDSVYIGRNITYNTSSSYGYSPFYRNTSLRTVVITDKETEISDNEFYGCTNLQSFKVGDGVRKFGMYSFSGCSSLKSLSFGAQLQSIGQEAFSDCNAVTTIVSKATTPPVCGSQALDDISKWECSLYVPEGTLSAYQAADQWKEFFFTAEGAEDIDPEEQNPTINKCATPTINIVDGKIKFASETEGAEFIYRITPSTALSGNDEEAPMLTKYTISVYAKKDGFIQSDEATKEIKIGNLDGIRGDVNNDGTVSMPDAMFIVNKILHGKFPDEE